MGATAEERLMKRRINDMEEKLKRMQRELQKLKSFSRRDIPRARKKVHALITRETDLQELYEEELEKDFENLRIQAHPSFEVEGENSSIYHCRKAGCNSHDVQEIFAGPRIVILCNACKGRFSVANEIKQAV